MKTYTSTSRSLCRLELKAGSRDRGIAGSRDRYQPLKVASIDHRHHVTITVTGREVARYSCPTSTRRELQCAQISLTRK
jgi:hypothetical protein